MIKSYNNSLQRTRKKPRAADFRRCRRAQRDGNGGAKLSLDQFLAAVPKIKYEY